MVRVLIVDDSAFMRNALSNMLSSDAEINIVGTARDGLEAVQKAARLKPDIITMDVEMPMMDGIEALRRIMAEAPAPVIMVSSLTTEGARATIEALELGAVDFIPKNLSELSVNILKIKPMLIEKVKLIARKGMPAGRRRHYAPPVGGAMDAARRMSGRRIGLVSIGTSTGGPRALQEIIPALPKDLPVPLVVAQHMPQNFTRPFAERLDQLSRIEVKEAEDGEPLKKGVAYIAPGGGHIRLVRRGIDVFVNIFKNDEYIYRPSVDHLLLSSAECFPGRCLAVILTGMGNDGLKGAEAVKKKGGSVLTQDEETCTVYGMPRAVVEAGIVDKILPAYEIAGEIINSV